MFILRQTHQGAFQNQAEECFVREVMTYLRENHSETIVKLPSGELTVRELDDNALRKMIIGGIEKARRYGMLWCSTLISFVIIMFEAAPNFDEDEQIRKLLTSDSIFPESRIDSIWNQTDEETWLRVSRNYQPESWY